MDRTKGELITELKELQLKHAALEEKYAGEINRLQKKEEDLCYRLMFLEGVANSTVDGFLVVNPYGQKILQNQQTIDLWKIPKEIVEDPSGIKQVNHVMQMTVDPQKFIAEIDYLREHPDDKSRDELELIDGTVLDRYSSPVIGPDGKNYGRIWTFHDISERKNAEKQLIQLNADKDRFISILAHDLRSPFSSLLGFSQMLKKELRHFSFEKIEEIVESIYCTAHKTYELLEDTLSWASVRSKKITFYPTVTRISELIYEVSDILEPIAKAKRISIENVSDNELFVNADIFMLKAILRNLISNAIKFTGEGGKIQVSALQDHVNTTIQVADNGVGINPEALEKLFSFSSFHSTTGTANESGTGFGLILCKEYVEKHGGKIWMDSTVNQGTSVNFTIPSRMNEIL
jgi:signal transduction histidine kinase